jgi:hypothetical protein
MLKRIACIVNGPIGCAGMLWRRADVSIEILAKNVVGCTFLR